MVISHLEVRTMNKTLIVVGIVTIVTALSGMASAKGKKAHRSAPVVCLSYQEVKDGASGGGFGVCLDGAKPRIFENYSLVQIQDQDESERLITVMVGWK